MEKVKIKKCIWRQNSSVMDFVKEFPHISISDLDDILESLYDKKLLNKKGEDFWNDFWETFIKGDDWD